MQAIHDPQRVRFGGEKCPIVFERRLERCFIAAQELANAGGLEEPVPRHRRFQLITSRAGGPARFPRQRTLVRQRQNRMNRLACLKIRQHRPAGRNGGVAELGFASHTPSTQQSAHNDAAIEKIRERRALRRIRRELERKRAKLRIPCYARKKTRRAECRVQVLRIARPLMQEEESADGVAGYFGGDAGVLAEVRTIVTRHAAACFLNSRVQEPAAGRVDQGIGRRQRKSL